MFPTWIGKFYFPEPLTRILGVPEGDVAGEIFINQGSTINITCIVRNLPEKSSMFWTHNEEVRDAFICVGEADRREIKTFFMRAIKFGRGISESPWEILVWRRREKDCKSQLIYGPRLFRVNGSKEFLASVLPRNSKIDWIGFPSKSVGKLSQWKMAEEWKIARGTPKLNDQTFPKLKRSNKTKKIWKLSSPTGPFESLRELIHHDDVQLKYLRKSTTIPREAECLSSPRKATLRHRTCSFSELDRAIQDNTRVVHRTPTRRVFKFTFWKVSALFIVNP